MKKDERLNIRLLPDEKSLLEQDAKAEQRSVSNFLLWCWKQWREAKKGKTNERRSSK